MACRNIAEIRTISVEQPVHDSRPSRVGEKLALVADQAAGGRMENNALAARAGRPHVLELGAAGRKLLHHDAGEGLIDIDDRLPRWAPGVSPVCSSTRKSTRGRPTVNSKPSRRMVSMRIPSCNSPRPATSNASVSVSEAATRSATLPSASLRRRSRITRL